MSQQINASDAEKHVAKGNAAIADKEIVSIIYNSSYFIYILYLYVSISILENSPKFP